MRGLRVVSPGLTLKGWVRRLIRVVVGVRLTGQKLRREPEGGKKNPKL
jgi:hypothetical protein